MNTDPLDPSDFTPEPPSDELDALLRTWHRLNADRAHAVKDRILKQAGHGGSADSNVVKARANRTDWRLIMTRYSPIAAVFVLLTILIPAILRDSPTAQAQDIVSSGGRLDILDAQGNVVGSCPLKHTDVDVQVSGRFARVNLTQTFHNTSLNKVEAVYTFPMSHRAAVDRMTMTVGDRVIIGEVKERRQARQIYEAARAQGHVAGLLEQERPNIFTQSVANIEPNADIDIRISYVETLDIKDGLYSFDFPMVVGPRYVPGSPTGSTGAQTGQGFSPDTTQVPDASRITPMPVHPTTRAGHDIGIAVTIDTGGPGILDLKSELHDITRTKTVQRDDGSPRKVSLMLKKEKDIPNRDFVLSWRQTADAIQEATFAHTGKNGSFFTLMLQPPARVKDAQAVARELVFVMDTSGSMSGLPIAKSRDVVSKCLAALRPQDSFNIMTFSGDTHVLWDKPRPGTPDNIAAAQKFVESREGSGGTEMMKAIEAALVQTPQPAADVLSADELANLPADGRAVLVRLKPDQLRRSRPGDGNPEWAVIQLSRNNRLAVWSQSVDVPEGQEIVILGEWATAKGRRVLNVREVRTTGEEATLPIRICCFLTDGYVGNDMDIVAAIQRNAKTTRVFSFGIGNSVNRYLLDNMARAGRGEVEYVLLNSEADAAAERFARRVQTPVLRDVELTFGGGLEVADLCGPGLHITDLCAARGSVPPGAAPGAVPPDDPPPAAQTSPGPSTLTLPDLFDVKPIVIHGRYVRPGRGTVVIRGRTADGLYERKLELDLPADQPEHDTIATLWARSKVEQLMNRDLSAAQQGNFPTELHDEIVRLGEAFGIMTQFTSFVAVEKQRITLGGKPLLVTVPIEMPQGVSYEGIFGCQALERVLTEAPVNARGERLMERVEGRQEEEKLVRQNLTRLSAVGKLERQLDRVDHYGLFDANAASAAGEASTYSRVLSGGNRVPMTPKQFISRSASSALHYWGDTAGKSDQWYVETLNEEDYLYSLSISDFDGDGVVDGSGNVPLMGGLVDAKDTSRLSADAVKLQTAAKPSSPSQRQLSRVGRAKVATEEHLAQLKVDGAFIVVHDAPATQPSASVTTAPATAAPGPEPAAPKEPPLLAQWVRALGTAGQLEWSRQALVPQRVAIQIGEAVQAGKLDDAKAIADALVALDPDFKIGVQMRETIHDAKLSAAERDSRIAGLVAEAKKAFEPVIRELKLRHRLDPRLYAFAKLGPAAATRPAGAGVTLAGDELRVTILVADVTDQTVETLRKAALKVEASARPSSLVVGLITPDKLADLAVLDAVRRVIPTETQEPLQASRR